MFLWLAGASSLSFGHQGTLHAHALQGLATPWDPLTHVSCGQTSPLTLVWILSLHPGTGF